MDIILIYENNIDGGGNMNINLTAKEKMLLEDQKKHEELCIQKYSKYENLASDQQLKNIFINNAQIEREHLNTINQLLSGQVPSTSNQQNSQQQMQSQQNMQNQNMQFQQMKSQQPMQQSSSVSSQTSFMSSQNSDKELCSDILMTEKFVSGAYDTAIFEFKDSQVRNVLNHIQKEEQQHGESVFKYMESKGMYTLK